MIKYKKGDTVVYVITDGNNYKIGFTSNIKNRLSGLQTSNSSLLKVLYLFIGDKRLERKLHIRFKRYKTESNNEWFDFKNRKLVDLLSTVFDIDVVNEARDLAVRLVGDTSKLYSDVNNKLVGKELQQAKGLIRNASLDAVVNDIRLHIRDKKDIVISYTYYSKKYGLSAADIKFAVKKGRLGYDVMMHNKECFK